MKHAFEKYRKIVNENLANAKENGYFDKGEQLHGATVEEIADDMRGYSADCADIPAAVLAPFIKDWLAAHVSSRGD